MNFKKALQTFLKIFVPLSFGCLLLWYLYSKMDLNEIWHVIRKGVRYEIILFSLLFGLGANIIRGFRWKLLINSVGDEVKISNAIHVLQKKLFPENRLHDSSKSYPKKPPTYRSVFLYLEY